jgi:hypothetical protein
MGGAGAWPYKSTAKNRGLVLLALGIVKVATAEQLRQLVLPGTADVQTVRNVCKDLRSVGLVESVGRHSVRAAGMAGSVEPDHGRPRFRRYGGGPPGAGDGWHRKGRGEGWRPARPGGHGHDRRVLPVPAPAHETRRPPHHPVPSLPAQVMICVVLSVWFRC